MFASRPMIRRCFAAGALVALVGSAVEPGFGLLRDGAVHHESTTEATQHASLGHGEHGDRRLAAEAPTTPSTEHEHGTSMDHCTHVHGPALQAVLPTLAMSFRASIADDPLVETHGRSPLEALFHPPKA